MEHQSDSAAQRKAEMLIRAGLAEVLHVDLSPKTVAIGEGAAVAVDGVAQDESVLMVNAKIDDLSESGGSR